ncbi:hypothetical protein [Geminocystis sp. GBBB08]|uniref:hypothetical protein n=1 Tax=Geminocystis sp. GBBB08 TaxID=2604140 RepID=UPI0027E27D92|nr:hypothetical protein [Geminocystis sp. GBBB08]
MRILDNKDKNSLPIVINRELETESNHELILCQHCLRTSSNGIKCKGICVADNDY